MLKNPIPKPASNASCEEVASPVHPAPSAVSLSSQDTPFLSVPAEARAIELEPRNRSSPQKLLVLSSTPIILGRKHSVKITPTNGFFDCKVLSRQHAKLWIANGQVWIQDLGSSNGTFVNNTRLEEQEVSLCHMDILELGIDVQDVDGTALFERLEFTVLFSDVVPGAVSQKSTVDSEHVRAVLSRCDSLLRESEPTMREIEWLHREKERLNQKYPLHHFHGLGQGHFADDDDHRGMRSSMKDVFKRISTKVQHAFPQMNGRDPAIPTPYSTMHSNLSFNDSLDTFTGDSTYNLPLSSSSAGPLHIKRSRTILSKWWKDES
ncbi:SMAD/FHA domain-containing protein [Polychytrium aggregatum]|uniref:SMAD/FHA domain-containing protein n=1 Tax=Polychytrium aggregatum TaxID=110093 RepID=UPI0022FE2AEC|nr:SMAD/FHA domain-containing protein [Polychytrium aggregatum]KAI9204552.1 SMAD/FHA domain-containing protein [Polychytrium aggregatum]